MMRVREVGEGYESSVGHWLIIWPAILLDVNGLYPLDFPELDRSKCMTSELSYRDHIK